MFIKCAIIYVFAIQFEDHDNIKESLLLILIIMNFLIINDYYKYLDVDEHLHAFVKVI